MAKARKLMLAIGSDHVDLQAAIERNITVAEVTCCNSISVAEHVVMMILALGATTSRHTNGWSGAAGTSLIASSAPTTSRDACRHRRGRPLGTAVLRRLKPFDAHLRYYDRHRLPRAVEKELSAIWHPTVEDMVKVCDVVTINAPLHPETEHLFNDALVSKTKRGAYLVNRERGKFCDRDAIVRVLESGRLASYAGDVWFPQPAPKDHPWRTMPHHGSMSQAHRLRRRLAMRLASERFSNAGSRAGRSARNV
jgi:formate dehydrogenase